MVVQEYRSTSVSLAVCLILLDSLFSDHANDAQLLY